jgi:UDP-GlcNAc:undecaprenyl-phosphate GlcNAc-1-phosphate transferase
MAVFAGTVVGAVAGRPTVLLPLAAALCLGVCDDVVDLPAGVRLAGQLAVGVLVAATVPLHLPGVVGVLAAVVVTVLVVNGVNLIDGLDMLAGGVAAVAAAGFAAVLHGAGRHLAVAVSAALVGFLLYNRPPARIYLGDGGSYLVGAALTVLLAYCWAPGVATPVGTAALALVAVVVAEVAFAATRRARSRRSPLAGDRRHPYDLLVARGWPRPAASLTYIGVEAVLAAGAVAAAHLGSMTAAVVMDLAAAAVLVAVAGTTGALAPDQRTAR